MKQLFALSSGKLRCYFLRQGKPRLYWDLSIILASLYYSAFITLSIGFEPEVLRSLSFIIINFILDGLFVIDILFNLRTTFYNKDGDQVRQSKEMACRYIKRGTFAIDILAVLPLYLLGLPILKILSAIKLVRLYRITKIIKKLNISAVSKIKIKIVFFTLFLYGIVHLMATLWGVVVVGKQHWIPPIDWLNFNASNFQQQSLVYQYLLSYYYSAIGALNVGDMGPEQVQGLIAGSIIMFSGAILNANAFGIMAVLVEILQKSNKRTQEKLDILFTTMNNLKLQGNLKKIVKLYILGTDDTLHRQNELTFFIAMLSPSLKRQVYESLYIRMLINNTLFRSLKDILSDPTKNFQSFGTDPRTKQPFKSSVSVFFYRQENNKQTKIEQLVDFMVHFMEPVLTLPEQNVFKQGEMGDALYFISSGGVAVYQRILCGMRQKRIGNLRENQHFGQLSLLFDCARTATIKSNKYSILARINKPQFIQIIEQYPTFLQSLRLYASKYKDSRNQSVSKLLKRFSYFKHLDIEYMKEVVYNLKVAHYYDKDVILAAGSHKNDLGLILDGYAAYQIFTEGMFIPLKMLGRGKMINFDRCAVRKRQVLYLCSVGYTSIAWMKQSTFSALCEKYPAIANQRK